MSYQVKLHHFQECVRIKFAQPICMCMGIRNTYVSPSKETYRTQIYVWKLTGLIIILVPQFSNENLDIVVI